MITNKKRQDWRTPREVFAALHKDYRFTIDGAASVSNHLLPNYLTRAHDLLNTRLPGERVYINPPFGMVWEFLAWGFAQRRETFSCFLIPANLETDWFHSLAVYGSKHIFKRRVSYEPPQNAIRYDVDAGWIFDPVKASQPSFASMLVMYGPETKSSGLGFERVRDGATGEIVA